MPPILQSASRTLSDGIPVREFTATVTEIRELCRVDGKPLFQLTLDKSPFEPAEVVAGGNLGTLTATSRTGAVLIAPVTAVQRDVGGELWHTTVKPLQQGTVVICAVESAQNS